jgi:hypothetical protein
MKISIIALAVVLTAGSAASAAEKVTDVDFLRANRCKGLATTLTGVVDPASLNAFIKAESGARAPYVLERASEEFTRAKREARGEDRKDRLTAELTGPCQAYFGPASNVAKQ